MCGHCQYALYFVFHAVTVLWLYHPHPVWTLSIILIFCFPCCHCATTVLSSPCVDTVNNPSGVLFCHDVTVLRLYCLHPVWTWSVIHLIYCLPWCHCDVTIPSSPCVDIVNNPFGILFRHDVIVMSLCGVDMVRNPSYILFCHDVIVLQLNRPHPGGHGQ